MTGEKGGAMSALIDILSLAIVFVLIAIIVEIVSPGSLPASIQQFMYQLGFPH